jgi:hypothetical protein
LKSEQSGGGTATEIEVTSAVDTQIDVVDEGSTIFDVLANQARGRTTSELRTTAVGFAVNSALILWYHPGVSWLAAAFAAMSAYGVWGLADRFLSEEPSSRVSTIVAKILRRSAAIGGSAAALLTVFWFMAAALINWHH